MGKHKNGKKRAKESQLAIRVDKDERDVFVKLCEEMDTTAAREIRRFMRDYVAANRGKPGTADSGANAVELEALAAAASASPVMESEANNDVGDQATKGPIPDEKDKGKASGRKHKN